MKNQLSVIVGNIGTTYEGTNGLQARQDFFEYKKLSEDGYGRCAHEPVILMKNGEIEIEHFGSLEQE